MNTSTTTEQSASDRVHSSILICCTWPYSRFYTRAFVSISMPLSSGPRRMSSVTIKTMALDHFALNST